MEQTTRLYFSAAENGLKRKASQAELKCRKLEEKRRKLKIENEGLKRKDSINEKVAGWLFDNNHLS